MKKLLIVANPRAGRLNWLSIIQKAQREIWGWELDVKLPHNAEAVKNLFSSLDANIYEAVIIVGGDGSLNLAIAGLMEKGIPLAVFPAGTANDLASQQKLTADWLELLHLIHTKSFHEIDVIQVNDRYFATVGGLGLAAEAAACVNKHRSSSAVFRKLWNLVGSDFYGIVAAKLVLIERNYLYQLKIECEGFEFIGRAEAVLIANQSFLGKDFKVAPQASNTDGQFDLIVLKDQGRARIVQNLLQAKYGDGLRACHQVRTNTCRITCLDKKSMKVFGDGEQLTEDNTLQFSVIPKALKVYNSNELAVRRRAI